MGMDAGRMQLMLNFLEEPLQIDSSFCELKFYLVFQKSLYNDETSNMTSLNRKIKKNTFDLMRAHSNFIKCKF